MTEGAHSKSGRPPCMLRWRWRSARRLGWQELETDEDIALEKKREELKGDRSERHQGEAKAHLEIVRGYVLLALTVISTIVALVLLIENPHAIPVALGGLGTGGGIATIVSHHRSRNDEGPGPSRNP